MSKIRKGYRTELKRADPQADIALINQYALKELSPQDVYCFSIVLCDNEVDRDCERFTDETLNELAEKFVGRTVISDHVWQTENQVARIYRAQVETTDEKTTTGIPLKRIVASAYMLKNEVNQPIIDSIEAGIIKETSVSVGVREKLCSICGEKMVDGWVCRCKNDHEHGKEYDGVVCVAELHGGADAYECSFVAVPAQRQAGVIKSVGSLKDALDVLMTADLTDCDRLDALINHCIAAKKSRAELEERQKIIEENVKYLKKT